MKCNQKSHNLLILSKCKRPEEHEFSLRLAAREKWVKRELERQQDGALFKQVVSALPNVSPRVTPLHPAAECVFKDSSLLAVLDLPEGHSEGELQRGLVASLKKYPIDAPRHVLSRFCWRVVFVNHPRLDFSQFQEALAAANRHFSEIRKKYPTLRAYLVLSLPGGQTKLDSELVDSVREFPSLLLDSTAKTKTLELIRKLKPKESTKPEQIQLKAKLKDLAKDLEFDGRVQVELRFHDLDYDLIWKLQSDELVDRELTPQTRASIKIVLGSISRLSHVIPKNTCLNGR